MNTSFNFSFGATGNEEKQTFSFIRDRNKDARPAPQFNFGFGAVDAEVTISETPQGRNEEIIKKNALKQGRGGGRASHKDTSKYVDSFKFAEQPVDFESRDFSNCFQLAPARVALDGGATSAAWPAPTFLNFNDLTPPSKAGNLGHMFVPYALSMESRRFLFQKNMFSEWKGSSSSVLPEGLVWILEEKLDGTIKVIRQGHVLMMSQGCDLEVATVPLSFDELLGNFAAALRENAGYFFAPSIRQNALQMFDYLCSLGDITLSCDEAIGIVRVVGPEHLSHIVERVPHKQRSSLFHAALRAHHMSYPVLEALLFLEGVRLDLGDMECRRDTFTLRVAFAEQHRSEELMVRKSLMEITSGDRADFEEGNWPRLRKILRRKGAPLDCHLLSEREGDLLADVPLESDQLALLRLAHRASSCPFGLLPVDVLNIIFEFVKSRP